MHTCGIYSNSEVKNIRAQPIMIPVTLPDTPDFASVSWFKLIRKSRPRAT